MGGLLLLLSSDISLSMSILYVCICTYLSIYLSKYLSICVCMRSHSVIWLFATPWTVAHQVPLSMEFSKQEFWNRLPFPPPGDLPNSGMKPTSPASPELADGFFYTWEAPIYLSNYIYIKREDHCSTTNIIYPSGCLGQCLERCRLSDPCLVGLKWVFEYKICVCVCVYIHTYTYICMCIYIKQKNLLKIQ